MNNHFDAKQGLIVVQAKVIGPTHSVMAELALDTGCEQTSINRRVLESIGYDLETIEDSRSMITGSGIVTTPELRIRQIQALSRRRQNLKIFCHDLPAELEVDGMLGLDFFRDRRLTLDFKTGKIELE